MKAIKYIGLMLGLLFMGACSDDDAYKEQRETLTASTEIGIYRDGDDWMANGKAWLAFDKEDYQYYCNPNTKTFRIVNDEGTEYTTLQLEALPTENTKVSGTLTGNMGVQLQSLTGVYLLKKDARYVWLWSDDAGVGFILPKWGLDN